jgi:hypothetical protein
MGPDYEHEEVSDPKEEEMGKEKMKDETKSKSDISQGRECGWPTVPIRVEKVMLKDFESFSFDFWKSL